MICVAALTAFMWWMLTKTDRSESYRSYYIHTKELPVGIKENSEVKFSNPALRSDGKRINLF